MPLSIQDLDLRLLAAREAAMAAARRLWEEFHRDGGPRGAGSHADVDDEVEALIAETLARACPGDGMLGEELGMQVLGGGGRRGGHLWIVDPNDGTSPFLKGFRGSAVSIGLVEDGQPALGVVQAWDGPGGAGLQVAWRRGGPVLRDGVPVKREWPEVEDGALALVSHEADRKNSRANAVAVAPLRYAALPSIALRMALVAVGEGDVTVSLGGPESWDLAGGHALLLGAGGDLLNGAGRPLVYTDDGTCSNDGRVFGGAPALLAGLAGRDWELVSQRAAQEPGLDLSFPLPGAPRPDDGRLDRARGCLLGLLAGDSLGGLVEFQTAEWIRASFPAGVRDLSDGGAWGTLAGQPTDDGEMALHLARTLVRDGEFRPEAVAESYRAWLASGPFDLGTTTRLGLTGRPDPQSQANGALMRVAPLGVFGAGRPREQVEEWARRDAVLTHPHPVCGQASALFAGAVAAAVEHGHAPERVYEGLLRRAGELGVDSRLLQVIQEARSAPPADFQSRMGWVLVALHNALFQLLHAATPEEGLVDTVSRGGDTDTNAAIAGALLGAVHGAGHLPARWRLALLSCRPLEGLPGVEKPRPPACWPVDAEVLAERLLVAGWPGGR
jgi:ADP-ribosyl-[dinitrogen reductase] hydrolase